MRRPRADRVDISFVQPPPPRSPSRAAFVRSIRMIIRLVWRVRIEGVQNVPLSGPVILASNHLSVLDSYFLPFMLDRHVTFMAKAEYFTGRSLRGRLSRRWMTYRRQIPVKRGVGRDALDAMDLSLELVRKGGAFCIYPEGTRSPDGRLYKGRTGVAWLALMSGAPVIPVAMIGTEHVLPPGRKVPTLHRITIRFGDPLDLREFTGQATSARARRQVTDLVMRHVAELSGQQLLDLHAPAKAPVG